MWWSVVVRFQLLERRNEKRVVGYGYFGFY
jgi:hypothetical protein